MSILPAQAIEQIKENKVESIDISNNSTFGIKPDENAIAIAEALKSNTALKKLTMAGNSIAEKGARAIADALAENTTLEELSLENNKINHDGIEYIFDKGLRGNKNITKINLLGQAGALPGEKCLTVVVDVLTFNTTILDIIWRLGSRQSFAINKLLTRNREILRRVKAGMPIDDLDPVLRAEKDKKIAEERANGLPKFVAPEKEPEINEVQEATGGPYTLKQLQAKAEYLPPDVDANKREDFLSEDEFKKVFKMEKDTFEKSPAWKRREKKKQAGLF